LKKRTQYFKKINEESGFRRGNLEKIIPDAGFIPDAGPRKKQNKNQNTVGREPFGP